MSESVLGGAVDGAVGGMVTAGGGTGGSHPDRLYRACGMLVPPPPSPLWTQPVRATVDVPPVVEPRPRL
ncbi:hypothetical protein GCM10022226_58700 [Sphaerisporangium flaviroseum]|uniref:Uncharacterized protein n=1 Tax=Sphaerisporangium flaviroseum TaxID=509199 RepID=A0ABP7IYF2_9ACTN